MMSLRTGSCGTSGGLDHANHPIGAIIVDGEGDNDSLSEALPPDHEEGESEELLLKDAFQEIDTLSQDIMTKQAAYGGPAAQHGPSAGDAHIVDNDLKQKLALRTSEAFTATSSLPGAFDSDGRPLPKPSQKRLATKARQLNEERNHRHDFERYGPNIEPPETEQLPIDDLQIRMNTFITLANKEAAEAQQEDQSKQQKRRRLWLLISSGIVLVTIIAVVVGILLGTGGSSNSAKIGKGADSASFASEQCTASNWNESQESDRYQEIWSTIISINATMETQLGVANSAARASLCWLAYDDAFGLKMAPAGKEYRILQRFTLVLIYFHFVGEEGKENGLSRSNWLTSVPECQWDFLDCNEDEPEVVTSLLLHLKGLTGKLPSEITNLSKLTALQLTSNALTGEIPREIWTLTQLEVLTLNLNQLSGTISTELTHLLALRQLSLGGGSFHGTFPDISALTKLDSILVADTLDVNGPFPNISGLTNLGHMVVMSSAMTGSIPTHIGLLSKLSTLALTGTELTGTLPTELGNLVNIGTLDIDISRFSGTLPTELGNLSNLTIFSAFGASFLVGSIPSEMGRLSILEYLIALRAFGLTGTMPAEICALRSLSLVGLQVECTKVACDLDCCTACNV